MRNSGRENKNYTNLKLTNSRREQGLSPQKWKNSEKRTNNSKSSERMNDLKGARKWNSAIRWDV